MRRNWAIIILGYAGLGIVALIIGMLLGVEAKAQEPEPTGQITVSWTPPTLNEDGSAYTNFGGFKIYYGNQSGIYNNVIDLPDTTNTLSQHIITGLVYGTYYIAGTAYNSNNIESRYSNEVIKTVAASPLPPSLSFVTISTIVYDLVKRDDGFITVAVGRVELNTPCDINQSVMGLNVVPVSSVTSWLGSVRPKVVLAQCLD